MPKSVCFILKTCRLMIQVPTVRPWVRKATSLRQPYTHPGSLFETTAVHICWQTLTLWLPVTTVAHPQLLCILSLTQAVNFHPFFIHKDLEQNVINYFFKSYEGISLVVQGYSICLPMQDTWVWSLIWEDPHATEQLSLFATTSASVL